MHQLIISEDARLDALKAALWYESQRSGLGSEFELCLEAALNQIQRNPLHYEKRYEDFRIHFVSRFPYGIHYMFKEDIVMVFGIFHMHQNPTNWFNRQ
jgi:hypothetical protein